MIQSYNIYSDLNVIFIEWNHIFTVVISILSGVISLLDMDMAVFGYGYGSVWIWIWQCLDMDMAVL